MKDVVCGYVLWVVGYVKGVGDVCVIVLMFVVMVM